MLYMVECGFADPAREAAWNAWYSGPKLGSLVVLPGWGGSQRFQAVTPVPAPWLAIHSVPGPEFFQSAVYKNAGGGNFADWGPLITNWARNLFDGLDLAPEVPMDGLLAVIDAPAGSQPVAGITFTWLRGVGLDRTVADRAIAVLPAGQPPSIPGFRLYRPITRLLKAG